MASILRLWNHRRMRTLRAVVIAAATFLTAGAAGAAGPPSFHLVFDGTHNAQVLHEGTFTTSSSWCPSGTAADVSVDSDTDTATRRFSCAGGGDFIAKVGPLPAEHGGSGSWQIVDGSGPLTNLRGKGTFTSTRTGGDPNDPPTITFRSTWDGVADFDVDPPTVAVKSVSKHKLKRPSGAYRLRVALSLSDAGGGAVSYALQVVNPKRPAVTYAYKTGQATGIVTRTFRIKVPKTRRVVGLKVDASDPVGNASTAAKKIRLR